MHTKAHDGDLTEKRGNLLIFRALRIFSSSLGISGECDNVEFYKSDAGVSINGYDGLWLPYPVEYKRGKSKLDDCDRLQLCAQGVCLEEMLCTKIHKGAIFYGDPRRREVVDFTEELRLKLRETTKTMHSLFARKHTPKAVKTKACNSCSIKDLCLPVLGQKDASSVKDYMEANME